MGDKKQHSENIWAYKVSYNRQVNIGTRLMFNVIGIKIVYLDKCKY